MVPLLIESWIWWSIVIIVAASRFVSRRMTLGSFRKFQADDYLMLLALCFYTTLIVTINIVRHTSSNLLPPGFKASQLTPADKREREYGSKLILVVEQCQCATIWLVKGCLVFLYLRLTTVHKENILIKVLGAYVVVTFVVMDILYFGVWCQPFHEYWAVPTDSSQCDAATNHLITNACFNLSSDVAMLLIVLPIFLRMKLPWRKKAPLIALFSLGIFTIVAAILNKVYSFSQPYGSLWTFWYTRESSTALLVANLPFVWTLWARIPVVRTLIGASKSRSQQKYSGQEPGVSTDTADGKPKGAKTAEEWLAEDGVDEHEMEGGMSLAEILGEQNPASIGEKEPNPITHPQLFYSMQRASLRNESEAGIAKDPKDARRDSSPDAQAESSMPSSNYPSLTSKRSAGSFV